MLISYMILSDGENMVDIGTGDGENKTLTEEGKITKRISLVKQLQDAGYKTATSIAKKLKDKEYDYLDISANTIRRDIIRIKEEGRDFIENRVLTGEFVIDHHEALLEFKRIRDRCSEKVAQITEKHDIIEDEIAELGTDARFFTESDKVRLKIQNDVSYNTIIQNNEKILSQATKDFTLIASKTETVWSLKKWIKENDPKALERADIQEIINEFGDKEKGDSE